MAGGGWAQADCLAGADPLNPDNQKISIRQVSGTSAAI
jgi:hypothetical protein